MALRTGDRVPDLAATSADGSVVRLSELLARGPVVLFFYPKADTPGCTAEACHFRDLAAEFAEVGAERVGVSRDDPATQAGFVDANRLDFPVLCDRDGSLARVFGAKRPGPLWSRRHTFVIDADGTLLGSIRSETDMEAHADQALELLRGRP